MRCGLNYGLNVVGSGRTEKYGCGQTSNGSIKANLISKWRREGLHTLERIGQMSHKRTCRLSGDHGVNRQQHSDKKGEVGPTSQPGPYVPLPDGLPEL
jgi:hypothetical protein